MTRYGEALDLIRAEAEKRPLSGEERVSLDQALGRVAAHDVLSDEIVPPFDNSAMDGFAIRSEWTRDASAARPLRFRVLGSIVAGDAPPPTPTMREPWVWEIMTGAPFPEGFDAAIPIERVRVHRGSRGEPVEIEITEPAELDQFRRDAGEDFRPGMAVLRRGHEISAEHLLALASLGYASLPVRAKPKVAILSTGRELVEPGSRFQPGQIRNSTAPFLRAALAQLGCAIEYHGIVADDPSFFEKKFHAILDRAPDLVITTGAVSMGKHDFVKASLQKLGARVQFHKAAIRPGKPLLFASFPQGPAVFALPGNPVSTVVGLRFFFEPYLRAAQGQSLRSPIRARLENGVTKPEGLRCFYKAALRWDKPEARVRVLPGQASFLVRPLLSANAWAVLEEDVGALEAGAIVDVYPREGFISAANDGYEKDQGGCC